MNKFIPTMILLFLYWGIFSQDSLRSQKILIVATNVDVLGKNENGTYLVEIAFPFQYFIDKGYEVDIVTPKGGQAALYPKEYAGPGLGKIQRSELFVAKTGRTLAPTEVNDTSYAAIYYPGGYGQFFDVVKDDHIALLTVKIYEKGGIIASAGHGTASLTNIKLSSGKYLVEGKTMTCFPHWVELQRMFQSDYGKLLPFDMEKVLTERGANLVTYKNETKQSGKGISTIVDEKNRMVTGAFADDALWVAEETVRLMQFKAK